MSLNQLASGQPAIIEAINASERLRVQMMALGLRVGRRLLVLRRAPMRGPLHLRIGATEIMIRRRDAAGVRVVVADA